MRVLSVGRFVLECPTGYLLCYVAYSLSMHRYWHLWSRQVKIDGERPPIFHCLWHAEWILPIMWAWTPTPLCMFSDIRPLLGRGGGMGSVLYDLGNYIFLSIQHLDCRIKLKGSRWTCNDVTEYSTKFVLIELLMASQVKLNLNIWLHLFAIEDGQSSKLFERRSKTRHTSQSWCREIGRCA